MYNNNNNKIYMYIKNTLKIKNTLYIIHKIIQKKYYIQYINTIFYYITRKYQKCVQCKI